jgi:hypothetical protein
LKPAEVLHAKFASISQSANLPETVNQRNEQLFKASRLEVPELAEGEQPTAAHLFNAVLASTTCVEMVGYLRLLWLKILEEQTGSYINATALALLRAHLSDPETYSTEELANATIEELELEIEPEDITIQSIANEKFETAREDAGKQTGGRRSRLENRLFPKLETDFGILILVDVGVGVGVVVSVVVVF